MEKPVFVRNAWYIAAESRELGTQPLGRLLLEEPVVLYRRSDGTPVALEDRCCHRRAPLWNTGRGGDCGHAVVAGATWMAAALGRTVGLVALDDSAAKRTSSGGLTSFAAAQDSVNPADTSPMAPHSA